MSTSRSSRAAHWVLRSGDLRKTLDFLGNVFNMVPIRHEENEAACGMTCNGRFDRPWSKTMVGPKGHLEDRWFCLEVTYNYGVKKYPEETPAPMALNRIQIGVLGGEKGVEEAVGKAREMGYKCVTDHEDSDSAVMSKNSVIGPDSYVYEVTSLPEGREEPFSGVYLSATESQSEELRRFYCDILGMTQLKVFVPPESEPKPSKRAIAFAYRNQPSAKDFVPIIFELSAADSDIPKPGALSGRFAISYENVAQTYDKILNDETLGLGEKHVVHKLDTLKDKLGDLEIAIVTDPCGYEICLVTNTVFDASVREAANWEGPDWEKRAEMGG